MKEIRILLIFTNLKCSSTSGGIISYIIWTYESIKYVCVNETFCKIYKICKFLPYKKFVIIKFSTNIL